MRKLLVSVIGGHVCNKKTAELAEQIGDIIASEGAILVCGGLGGVMEAACKGAKKKGGVTVGIIPGENKNSANKFVDIVITTGMGYSRNTIVTGAADLLVAFQGEYGTLSEIAFALNARKKVYGFGTWDIKDVIKLDSIDDFRNILRQVSY